jgi:hypothetical protein
MAREGPMTTLPATYLEAAAVDYARECITFVRDGKLKMWGVVPGAWFEKGESQRACRLAMGAWALENATNLMEAVALARAGFEMWVECLRDLILEYQNRGENPPIYLAAFAMDLTHGIPGRPGRQRSADQMRDIVIGTIVGMVSERFNLRATRNAASRHPSGCSVMTTALRLEGMAMSEDNVVQLWKTMPAHFKNRPQSQWVSA